MNLFKPTQRHRDLHFNIHHTYFIYDYGGGGDGARVVVNDAGEIIYFIGSDDPDENEKMPQILQDGTQSVPKVELRSEAWGRDCAQE